MSEEVEGSKFTKVQKEKRKEEKQSTSKNRRWRESPRSAMRAKEVRSGWGVRKVEFCEEESKEKREGGGQRGSESPVIALTLS